jgi:broad-specificity NMP kinase
MAALIFIAGDTGVGKTTYIRQKYHDTTRYFYLNFQRYTYHFALHKDYNDGLAAAFNQLHQEAMEAFIANRSIIIEMASASMDQETLELVYRAKKGGIPTEWIVLTLEEDERMLRLKKATNNPTYLSSAVYAEEQLEILQEVVECLSMQLQLQDLGTLSDLTRTIVFMARTEPDASAVFFFFLEGSNPDYFLDVDLKQEGGEIDYLACIKTYQSPEQMLKAALSQVNLHDLKVKLEESDWKERLTKVIMQASGFAQKGFSEEKAFLN